MLLFQIWRAQGVYYTSWRIFHSWSVGVHRCISRNDWTGTVRNEKKYFDWSSFSFPPSQDVLEKFDDLVVAAGSVGMACGLAVAKHLTKSSIKWVRALFFRQSILVIENLHSSNGCIFKAQFDIVIIHGIWNTRPLVWLLNAKMQNLIS